MKTVQDALKTTGIPSYPLSWRVTGEYQEPPDSYLVYTTRVYESEHWDDRPVSYTLLVYLNLWTKVDPNDSIPKVRAAMRRAGFGMTEEDVSYDAATGLTLVAWTWEAQMETEVKPDGA